MPGRRAAARSRGERIVRALVWLRFPIILAWVAGAVYVTAVLPTIEQAQVGALGDLVPHNAPAITAEVTSNRLFGFPLISRTIIVQHRRDGLSAAAQARVVARAAAIDGRQYPDLTRIAGAIPLTNTLGKPPFSRQNSTTALTYLFFNTSVSASRKLTLAHRLAREHIARPGDGYVGVTGTIPARHAQGTIVTGTLPLIELATIILVIVAVGLHFRAPGAAGVTVLAVALAYLVAVRVIAYVGEKIGVSVPSEVEPVIVVLLFGVITDYSIFFLSRMRRLLADGLPRLEAARRTTQDVAPIVATAATTIVLATLTLIVAKLGFLQAFGPGLAMAIIIAMAVSLTLIPALLATFGQLLFWPARPAQGTGVAAKGASARGPRRIVRSRAVRLAARHPLLVTIGTVAVLLAAAGGITQTSIGDPLIRGLPNGAGAKRAYRAASAGFAPGILAPTVLVVQQPGIRTPAGLRAAVRLQRLLERQPGVAAVGGPASDPVRLELGAAVSRRADAVRYVVILNADPLGSRAISILDRIQRAAPRLLGTAGLRGARTLWAGDTALVQETVNATMADLARVAPVVMAAVLLMLALFLRALLAPVYLLAASILALAAAFGIATYLFQDLLHYQDVTYYVPFAAAVLLVALGSDYNVFVVGRIWQEARRRPLREAIEIGGSGAARAITVAGIILGLSFALLALIDVQSFRELAVVMAVGLFIDTMIVRTLLVPALISLWGRLGAWPGMRRRKTAMVLPEGQPVIRDRRS
ncbi:MAG TPA: MMPL family transporter [Solirubrobacteraceae bacterium]|nr:MMPL family transporter [Solirubrobacteraceae bacterium]